jgi:hypothetical protein
MCAIRLTVVSVGPAYACIYPAEGESLRTVNARIRDLEYQAHFLENVARNNAKAKAERARVREALANPATRAKTLKQQRNRRYNQRHREQRNAHARAIYAQRKAAQP